MVLMPLGLTTGTLEGDRFHQRRGGGGWVVVRGLPFSSYLTLTSPKTPGQGRLCMKVITEGMLEKYIHKVGLTSSL